MTEREKFKAVNTIEAIQNKLQMLQDLFYSHNDNDIKLTSGGAMGVCDTLAEVQTKLADVEEFFHKCDVGQQ